MHRPRLPPRARPPSAARALRVLLCALCLLGVLAERGEAGGGPETVLVVVNADSPASLHVAADGMYRLAINAAGDVEIALGGKTAFARKGLVLDRQAYAGCALAKGWHRIHVAYTPSGSGELSIWLGGATVSGPLAGDALRH